MKRRSREKVTIRIVCDQVNGKQWEREAECMVSLNRIGKGDDKVVVSSRKISTTGLFAGKS